MQKICLCLWWKSAFNEVNNCALSAIWVSLNYIFFPDFIPLYFLKEKLPLEEASPNWAHVSKGQNTISWQGPSYFPHQRREHAGGYKVHIKQKHCYTKVCVCFLLKRTFWKKSVDFFMKNFSNVLYISKTFSIWCRKISAKYFVSSFNSSKKKYILHLKSWLAYFFKPFTLVIKKNKNQLFS